MKIASRLFKILPLVLFFTLSLLSFNFYLYSAPVSTTTSPEKTSESSRAVLETSVSTYDQLISAIREVRHASESRIEAAVEQEKVREAWETGKLIDEHILLHKERQEYGAQVVIKLAKDLGTSETELKYMLQFARTYPIRPSTDELPWGHYRELLSINDEKERIEITKSAKKEKWSQKELREAIKKRLSLSPQGESVRSFDGRAAEVKLSEAKMGKIGIYRIVEDISGAPVADLGFSNYLEVEKKKFKEGDFITAKDGSFVRVKDAKESDLYTYYAKVINIIDGDTFAVEIDLGFGFSTIQTLRLRALDAPELISREGKIAKEALEKALIKSKRPIAIKTSKGEDQYGRYLVDVWVAGKNIAQELLDSGVFTIRGDE